MYARWKLRFPCRLYLSRGHATRMPRGSKEPRCDVNGGSGSGRGPPVRRWRHVTQIVGSRRVPADWGAICRIFDGR